MLSPKIATATAAPIATANSIPLHPSVVKPTVRRPADRCVRARRPAPGPEERAHIAPSLNNQHRMRGYRIGPVRIVPTVAIPARSIASSPRKHARTPYVPASVALYEPVLESTVPLESRISP